MTYPVELSVELVPVWHRDPPQINIGVDSTKTVVLEHAQRFDFDFDGQGTHQLIVELLNKQDSDTLQQMYFYLHGTKRQISFR